MLAVGLPLQALANRHGGQGRILGFANTWLLLVSVIFYAWGEVYLVWVMIASCLLNYFGGGWCAPGRPRRRVALILVVGANLAVLAWFKYSGLAVESANRINAALGHVFGADLKLAAVALPLGISFYTFHGISYVVDVWREKVTPSRSLRDFMCYSTLFPQLVAGPIVRYSEVAQFFTRRTVGLDDLAAGANRFIIGLAKKALVANQVAPLADAVFALPDASRPAAAAWAGLVAYALQIYFDFSGYSDMAVGLGRMFGFTFPENFNYPYVASSVREFWRRWHMTLSRFFRDYLYVPLGGNRHGPLRTAMNLVTVFALCGLWHGASWNFLLWGLFHGAFLAAERILEPAVSRAPTWLRGFGHVYTIGVVLMAWVLFRADTWEHTVGYFRSLLGLTATGGLAAIPTSAGDPGTVLAVVVGIIFCMPVAPAIRNWSGRRPSFRPLVETVGTCATIAALALCLLAIGAGSPNPFIYYRF